MALLSLKKYVRPTYFIIALVVLTTSVAKAQVESVNHIALQLTATEKSNGAYTDFVQIPATNLPPFQNFDTTVEKNSDQNLTKVNNRMQSNEVVQRSSKRLAVLSADTSAVALHTDIEPTGLEFENEDLINNTDHETNLKTVVNASSQHTFSQVWLGSVFVVVGIVLGFFFGRGGFILSLVGLIFISIGVFIF